MEIRFYSRGLFSNSNGKGTRLKDLVSLTVQDGLYKENSPSKYYITPDSNLTYLNKFWNPTPENEELRQDGALPEMRKYLTKEKLDMLHSVGLYTIRDLAEADKYVILKLRGFDFPQVALENRMHFDDICDYRALAIAAVDKCR
jgi:hypothetical protein